MSDLSEAMDRANKRLEAMTQEERNKLYHLVLREELQRAQPLSENQNAKR